MYTISASISPKWRTFSSLSRSNYSSCFCKVFDSWSWLRCSFLFAISPMTLSIQLTFALILAAVAAISSTSERTYGGTLSIVESSNFLTDLKSLMMIFSHHCPIHWTAPKISPSTGKALSKKYFASSHTPERALKKGCFSHFKGGC